MSPKIARFHNDARVFGKPLEYTSTSAGQRAGIQAYNDMHCQRQRRTLLDNNATTLSRDTSERLRMA